MQMKYSYNIKMTYFGIFLDFKVRFYHPFYAVYFRKVKGED